MNLADDGLRTPKLAPCSRKAALQSRGNQRTKKRTKLIKRNRSSMEASP
jgi:hypothetical protein